MTTTGVIIIVVAVIALAAIGWMLYYERRRKELRARFGPEYTRAVHQYGAPSKAEEALAARARRMERIHIRSLSHDDQQRFVAEWQTVQRDFVDNPADSIQRADALVSEVMRSEGYPMADFEHRAEDISVDHPRVVEKYRLARAISERQAHGEAGTEDLRQAVIYYRDLFDDLLETHPTEEGIRR